MIEKSLKSVTLRKAFSKLYDSGQHLMRSFPYRSLSYS